MYRCDLCARSFEYVEMKKEGSRVVKVCPFCRCKDIDEINKGGVEKDERSVKGVRTLRLEKILRCFAANIGGG